MQGRSARYAVKDNHQFGGGEPFSTGEMAAPRKSGADATLQSYRTIPENGQPTFVQPARAAPEEQVRLHAVFVTIFVHA
jgi:hypothetical protein